MDKVGMMYLLMKEHTIHHPWSCLSTKTKPESIKPLRFNTGNTETGEHTKHIRRMYSAEPKLYKTLQDKKNHFLQQINYKGKKESLIKKLQIKRLKRNN